MLAVRARFSPDDPALSGKKLPSLSGQYTCHCSPCRPAESRQGTDAYTDRTEEWHGSLPRRIVVPDAEKCQDHRDVPVKRRFPKCLSMACAPSRSSRKCSKPMDRRSKVRSLTRGNICRDPVPEYEHVLGAMPNSLTASSLVDMPQNAFLSEPHL